MAGFWHKIHIKDASQEASLIFLQSKLDRRHPPKKGNVCPEIDHHNRIPLKRELATSCRVNQLDVLNINEIERKNGS